MLFMLHIKNHDLFPFSILLEHSLKTSSHSNKFLTSLVISSLAKHFFISFYVESPFREIITLPLPTHRWIKKSPKKQKIRIAVNFSVPFLVLLHLQSSLGYFLHVSSVFLSFFSPFLSHKLLNGLDDDIYKQVMICGIITSYRDCDITILVFLDLCPSTV